MSDCKSATPFVSVRTNSTIACLLIDLRKRTHLSCVNGGRAREKMTAKFVLLCAFLAICNGQLFNVNLGLHRNASPDYLGSGETESLS